MKEDEHAWREEMENQIDLMEDRLEMALELFITSHKIPYFRYKLTIKSKVRFGYE